MCFNVLSIPRSPQGLFCEFSKHFPTSPKNNFQISQCSSNSFSKIGPALQPFPIESDIVVRMLVLTQQQQRQPKKIVWGAGGAVRDASRFL